MAHGATGGSDRNIVRFIIIFSIRSFLGLYSLQRYFDLDVCRPFGVLVRLVNRVVL